MSHKPSIPDPIQPPVILGEQTETQRREVTCPTSHSNSVAKPMLELLKSGPVLSLHRTLTYGKQTGHEESIEELQEITHTDLFSVITSWGQAERLK